MVGSTSNYSQKDDKKEWQEKAAGLDKSVLLFRTGYTRNRYGRLKNKSGNVDGKLSERDGWIICNLNQSIKIVVSIHIGNENQ